MSKLDRSKVSLEDALEELPLFPLPQVVLFPRMSLPLHIFEQRYRKMVADCLDGHGAMVRPAQLVAERAVPIVRRIVWGGARSGQAGDSGPGSVEVVGGTLYPASPARAGTHNRGTSTPWVN